MSLKRMAFITSPLWLLPLFTLAINSSYSLVRATYLNGELGAFLYVSIPTIMSLLFFVKYYKSYNNDFSNLVVFTTVSILLALLGTGLTIFCIFSGGYTIA